MALNIKDPRVDRLASEIAARTGESKTAAVRTALVERKERLAFRAAEKDRAAALRALLENDIWPEIPRSVRGRKLGKRERERILGYGKGGV